MTARIFVLMALAGLPGCGPLSMTIGSAPSGRIERTVVQGGGLGASRVAVVDVTGFLFTGSIRGILSEGENPVGYLHERLEHARADHWVKALIIRVNSPGGTVTASDAMYREIRRFKELSGKPVVVLMMDMATSGGYYLSCAADRIVAYPTSITGSIGVLLQTFSVKGLLDRWDIRTDAIVSGPNKDIGSPLSELSPRQRAILQAVVDDFYGRFTSLVRRSRPNIPADRYNEVTDGRVFTGEQAAKLGLVDATGDLYDAFELAKSLARIKKAELVVLHREGSFVGSAYSMGPRNPVTQINLAQINLEGASADPTRVFLYLWKP